jgi:hypothetical protein
MNPTLDFVTDFVTDYASANGVTVPTDFNAQTLLDSVYARTAINLRGGFSHDDFDSLSDFGLALEIETCQTLGI